MRLVDIFAYVWVSQQHHDVEIWLLPCKGHSHCSAEGASTKDNHLVCFIKNTYTIVIAARKNL